MRELKAMKEKLRRHQVDIKMAEKQAKENRTKAEDARYKYTSNTKRITKTLVYMKPMIDGPIMLYTILLDDV